MNKDKDRFGAECARYDRLQPAKSGLLTPQKSVPVKRVSK